MLFVLGGSYQGKLDYVKEKYNLLESDIFVCNEDIDLDTSKRCIYHYEKYVMYAYKNGKTPICNFRKDQIVIMDDLNCGVVPIDPNTRAYREALGRSGSAITRNADEVVRVFCGLAQTLKTKTTKIYLLRHGKTKANIDHCYCGAYDIEISEQGKAELLEKKQKIAYPNAEGLDCYTSSLKRTAETFEILFGSKNYTKCPELNEMNFGSFEMRAYNGDLQHDQDFITWTSGNNESNVCPFGESSLIMKRRVIEKFKEIVKNGKDSIVVCHGGPITALINYYDPENGKNFYEIQPDNGEGYLLEFSGERLVRYSKIG